MSIRNGKDINLAQSSGTMPNLNGALLNWFQLMQFAVITKTLVNFSVVETSTPVNAQGVIQPYTEQQLQIRPEGERAFKWHTIHADPSLQLQLDDVVVYLGRKYRVMGKQDYSLYGYLEYHVIEDYQ